MNKQRRVESDRASIRLHLKKGVKENAEFPYENLEKISDNLQRPNTTIKKEIVTNGFHTRYERNVRISVRGAK